MDVGYVSFHFFTFYWLMHSIFLLELRRITDVQCFSDIGVMPEMGSKSLALLESQCEHSVVSKWSSLTQSQLQGLREAFNCPNSCSGHGHCNGHYECECDPGFTGNDCMGKRNVLYNLYLDSDN